MNLARVEHFEKNTAGRDFVVGDIHGMFTLLSQKLEEIGFDPTVDRLFSVGDLVDRGPKSEEFEKWLSFPWFHAVRGNHEQMVIDGVNDDTKEGSYAYNHFINGGQWLYGLPEVEQQCYALVAQGMPLAIEVETDAGLIGIIHAECPMDDWDLFKRLLPTNQQYFEERAMWSRTRIMNGNTRSVENIHKLYVGHTVCQEGIVVLGNVWYVDQGSCFTNKLTVIQIN